MALGTPTQGGIMTKRIQKVSAAVLALGALGLGGSAIAQGASSTEPVGGPDRDAIQAGDQTTPDRATAAAEQPGVESSSETAANSDGPGGHADEPGNAAADNQFQGAQ
jgi:hypothetical protein